MRQGASTVVVQQLFHTHIYLFSVAMLIDGAEKTTREVERARAIIAESLTLTLTLTPT